MSADYSWWLDKGSRELHSRLETTLTVANPQFVQGDNPEIAIYLKREKPLSESGFDAEDFPTGGALRIGLVSPDLYPTGGTFSLGFGGDAASALDYNISAEDLSTALNALSSITSAGGVSVTGPAGGPWRVRFSNDGARALLTHNGELLEPSGTVDVQHETEGDSDTPAIQYIRVKQQTLAEQGSWSDIPASSVSVQTVVEGGSEDNEVQEVALTPYPRSGTFTLKFDADTTAPIAYTAEASTVQSALEALDSIVAGNVSVVKVASAVWRVEFIGDLAGANQDALTGSGAGLLSYEGKIGRLSMRRTIVQAYLDVNADENGNAPAILEIEIQDDDDNPVTYQFDCTIRNDGLEGTTFSGSETVRAYTTEESDARYPSRTPVDVPTSSTASGTRGDWAEDGTYLYLCIDTDTWLKVPAINSF